LVPFGRQGRGALSSFNDSMTQPARLKKAAFATYLSLKPRWSPGADQLAVTVSDPGAGNVPLARLIGDVVGVPVALGVALGRTLRPNRKPVLQAVDRHGRIVAFAKLGWNGHTRALVDAEADALMGLAGRSLSFAIPQVLYHGAWRERSVLVVSAGPTSLLRRSRLNEVPPARAERDVAASGWWSHGQLASSAYVNGLRSRIGGAGVTPASASRLEASLDRLVARDGDERFTFGAWHGDWAPWNMIRSADGLFVMDWERYGGPVPVGFDRLHFGFQLAHQVDGRSVSEAGARAIGLLRASARPLGLDADRAPGLLSMYLMERVLRVEEGSAAGMAIKDSLVPAVLEFVERADP
jgi:hypothetical protein